MDDNNEALKRMVDNTINGNDTQAQVDFHDYVQTKMQELVHTTIKDTKDSNTENEGK